MTSRPVLVLTVVAAVGSGVVGGAFYAFSTFVMRALDELPPQQSISAMQAINRQAPKPLFMFAFLGTALVCAVLGIVSVVRWSEPGAGYVIAGCVLSLLTVVITAAFHVPRNDALALVDPNAADPARTWVEYARPWVIGNHLRTLTSVAAAVLLTVGARLS